MKAEHRKELQTNVLADRVGKFLQGLKSRPDTTSLALIGFAVLAVALFIGWRYWSQYSERTRSALWLQLDEASNVENLDSIVKEGGSSQAGRIARFQKARVLLRDGLERMASYIPPPANATEEEKQNNPSPREKIEEARDLYAKLADESRDNPLLVQEALMGVAKAKESLDDLEGARAGYKVLAERYPKSFLGREAKKRADLLDEQAAKYKAFYEKFDELSQKNQ